MAVTSLCCGLDKQRKHKRTLTLELHSGQHKMVDSVHVASGAVVNTITTVSFLSKF